jgi:hypothetical protein
MFMITLLASLYSAMLHKLGAWAARQDAAHMCAA